MLLNELSLSVLKEFMGDYTGSFTGSYIAKKMSLNQKSVANILNKLEDDGLVKSKTIGKNKEFSLNLDNAEAVKNFIAAAEHIRTAEFLKKNPNATKRALHAILKSADACTRDPEGAARSLIEGHYGDNVDYHRAAFRMINYSAWRKVDPVDTLRFYALRLREAGRIKSTPDKIIDGHTDLRFLNDLKRELTTAAPNPFLCYA